MTKISQYIDKRKNRNPERKEIRNACLGGLAAMAKKSGTRPIQTIKDRLKLENATASKRLEDRIK